MFTAVLYHDRVGPLYPSQGTAAAGTLWIDADRDRSRHVLAFPGCHPLM
jgi:hypothetical protein